MSARQTSSGASGAVRGGTGSAATAMAISERTLRIVFVGLAVVNLAVGVWLFAFPHSFFTTIGAFGSYNRHYERDTATFYFAFALGAWIAATRPAWRVPVLA